VEHQPLLNRELWKLWKINKRKSCCILVVAYIVVLVMHGNTNINLWCGENAVNVGGMNLLVVEWGKGGPW